MQIDFEDDLWEGADIEECVVCFGATKEYGVWLVIEQTWIQDGLQIRKSSFVSVRHVFEKGYVTNELFKLSVMNVTINKS